MRKRIFFQSSLSDILCIDEQIKRGTGEQLTRIFKYSVTLPWIYGKSSSQLIFINAPSLFSSFSRYKFTGSCKLRQRILQGIPF